MQRTKSLSGLSSPQRGGLRLYPSRRSTRTIPNPTPSAPRGIGLCNRHTPLPYRLIAGCPDIRRMDKSVAETCATCRCTAPGCPAWKIRSVVGNINASCVLVGRPKGGIDVSCRAETMRTSQVVKFGSEFSELNAELGKTHVAHLKIKREQTTVISTHHQRPD